MHKPGAGLRDRLKRGIMFDLGYPVVKVEVPEPWLDEAIDRSISVFSKYSPQSEHWTIFTAIPGTNRYRVPDDYLAIRTVIYQPRMMQRFFANLYPYWDMWWGVYQSGNLTDYTIADMYHGQALRTFGIQGTWEFSHPYIYLYPYPTESVPVFVKYQKYLDLKDGDVREEDWIRDYALAVIKTRLGRARSKYSSLPGPRGDITMDGDKLIDEARSDMERLVDVLRTEYEEPLGFYTG
jgi:hypothetical protein